MNILAFIAVVALFEKEEEKEAIKNEKDNDDPEKFVTNTHTFSTKYERRRRMVLRGLLLAS